MMLKEKRSYLFANLMRVDSLRLLEIFHENTKIHKQSGYVYGDHIKNYFRNKDVRIASTKSFKVYHNVQCVPLTDSPMPAIRLDDLIFSRRSVRNFSPYGVHVEEISKLLTYSYGITGALQTELGVEQTLRAVPSGGALYPLELYVALFDSSDVMPGLYHFSPLHSRLELLKAGVLRVPFRDIVMQSSITDNCSMLLCISSVFARSFVKYQDRAYRFILLEAGHCAQNFCLLASALKLGTVCIGGYTDDEANRFLGLDGVNEAVIYMIAVGKPA